MTFSNHPVFALFLDRLSARSPLSEPDRQAILALPGRIAQIRANIDFVLLGEDVDHASLVVDGLVGRFVQTGDGNRQITALHINGDMADLHTVVAPQARSALQALANTTILRVPHIALRAAAAHSPAIAEAFWRDCVVDAAITAQWIVNIGRKSAQARIAHLICEMALRYEDVGKPVSMTFTLPATQTHLADALGLTSVHVSRCLGVLRQAKIATITSGVVHILDWSALIRTAEFDAGYLQIGARPGAFRPSIVSARG